MVRVLEGNKANRPSATILFSRLLRRREGTTTTAEERAAGRAAGGSLAATVAGFGVSIGELPLGP